MHSVPIGKGNKGIKDHSDPLPTSPSWGPDMTLMFRWKGRGTHNSSEISLLETVPPRLGCCILVLSQHGTWDLLGDPNFIRAMILIV